MLTYLLASITQREGVENWFINWRLVWVEGKLDTFVSWHVGN